MEDTDESADRNDGVPEQAGSEEKSTVESEEPEDLDLAEHPVGANREIVDSVADTVQETAQQGAIADVLSNYEPDEFNDLVNDIVNDYMTVHKRNIWFKTGTLLLSIILVLGLFFGLMYFALQTSTGETALIFFAGTLSGYFMRLASELH